jgi:uncharacterized protein YkwD
MITSVLFLIYQLYTHLDISPLKEQLNEKKYVLSATNTIEVDIPVEVPTIHPTITINPTHLPTPSPTPTTLPTRTPTLIPTKKPVENVLVNAVNEFRNVNDLGTLTIHPTLCTIADERLDILKKRTTLDNHEGFEQYKKILSSTFSQWGEVIFYSNPEYTPNDIVQKGWAQSAGHRDTLLKTEVDSGCGVQGDGFAVFIIGKKK